jgi:serine/threonine-protein kinase
MIPYEIVCRVMSNVCSALSAAHNATEEGTFEPQPIIHRDVSPHNILISTDGIAKLADFGIAKSSDSVDLTDTGEVHGKLAYMAPERLDSGTHAPDHRIDIFSTGVALFESLTLRRLFRRADRSLTIRAIKQLDVPRLDSLRPDAPPQIAQIISKALARNPNDRYETAEEMQLDLEEAITRCGHAVTSSHVAAWFKAVVAKGIEQDLARDLSIDSSTYLTEAVRARSNSTKR